MYTLYVNEYIISEARNRVVAILLIVIIYRFSALCFNALFMSSKFCLTAVSSHPSSDATIEPVNFSLCVKCTLLLLFLIGSIKKRCSPLNASPSDLPSHLSCLLLSATNIVGVNTIVPPLGSGMWTSSFSFLAGMPLIFLINGFQVGYFSKSVRICHTRLVGALISIFVTISFSTEIRSSPGLL